MFHPNEKHVCWNLGLCIGVWYLIMPWGFMVSSARVLVEEVPDCKTQPVFPKSRSESYSPQPESRIMNSKACCGQEFRPQPPETSLLSYVEATCFMRRFRASALGSRQTLTQKLKVASMNPNILNSWGC